MEPERIHDLTAAYALDALEPHEVEDFEEHLRHCERCREELAELHEVTTALAHATPPVATPPGLRDRIVEQARAEREERGRVIDFPVARRRTTWALSAAVAVAACAAIGLGIWAALLHSDLAGERSAKARISDAIAVVAAPGTKHVPLNGATGSLAVGASGQSVLVISDLRQAPGGKTYEAWVIGGATPVPAGLFSGGRTAVVPLTRLVQRGQTVAVTVERAGGVSKPSGMPILSAKLT